MNTRTYLSSIFGFIFVGLILTLVGYNIFPVVSTTQFWVEVVMIMGAGFAYNFCRFDVKVLLASITSLLMGSIMYPSIHLVGDDVITSAVTITALVTGTMGFLGFIYPKFFQKLGLSLFISLVLLALYGLFGSLFGFLNMTFYSWVGAGIFTLYIGYDVSRALELPRSLQTALDSAFSLYLDIINLFLNIVNLLGNSDD